MMLSPKGLLNVGLVAVLMLTGCSAKVEEKQLGPLEEYLAVFADYEAYAEQNWVSTHTLEQERIAECMHKEGFKYVPELQHDMNAVKNFEREGPEPGTLEYAQLYGYGVVEDEFLEFISQWTSEQEYSNPNEEYVASLTVSEQKAYDEALWGPPREVQELTENEVAGCANQARAGSGNATEFRVYDDPEYLNMLEAMGLLYGTIEDDPRAVEETAVWSACMAEEGYADLTTIWNSGQKLRDEWFAESSGEVTQQQKDEFMEREIKQAVADYKCREKSNYEMVLIEIAHEREAEFVEKHRESLDALVSKAEQHKR